ncbi:SAV_2336 N-terminal domain-related protein [Streptomyces sp. MUM 178J]|uniref:SAV_2336 N-terminal domain-related protein n=1 Tax=Streptomyces sp. MUM 178J TaxID=2791991 RepID=UPI001F03B0AC|nr:SAV_2336 N-terminal domain-related protein [Streptomyces sp. MUM 178J]WRQ79227.1 SAV_2336 N-terminal domain-related protein [Streptomyces sp. MUM 178J]
MTDASGEGGARAVGAVGTLGRLLHRASGASPTGRELAEVLWLARHMDSGDAPPDHREPRPGAGVRPAARARRDARPLGEDPAPPSTTPERVPLHAPPAAAPAAVPGAPATAPVRTADDGDGDGDGDGAGDGGGGGGWESLLAPAPPMLPRRLALQRALRPLRRRVRSAHGWELDAEGTAHRIAALDAPRALWLPVLRAKRERWLHLRFVFDTGPTMTMWRPLLRELRRAFAQTGAFRTVDTVRVGPDGAAPRVGWQAGRTAVLVLSDCMGPQWREGEAGERWYGSLRDWADRYPVAVVQPLPERLWRQTAFAPAAGEFSSAGPGAPGAALAFLPYASGLDAVRGAGPPLVPVLEPSPRWLGHWARLVGAPSGAKVPGAAAVAAPPPEEMHRASAVAADALDAEGLVRRFHAVASPQAFRLAAHLAVGEAQLPVMRLVQAAIDPQPQPQHLAEVVLSGLLTATGPAGSGAYGFRSGVRELLLGMLPRSALAATAQLLGDVGHRLDALAGTAPGEFRALVAARQGSLTTAGGRFALVSRESLGLLRGGEPETDGEAEPETLFEGRYALSRLSAAAGNAEVWRGHDRVLDRPVTVKIYTFDARAMPERWRGIVADFVTSAGEAARMTAQAVPQLAAVFHGFEDRGRCVLVTEPVDGPTLRQRLGSSSRGLAPELILEWGRELLIGLEALHAEGLTHGDLNLDNVMVPPGGGPVLSDYGLTWPPVLGDAPRYVAPEHMAAPTATPEGDLYALGRVLYEAATGYEERLLRLTAVEDPRLRKAISYLAHPQPSVRPVGADLLRGTPAPPSHDAPSFTYRVLGSPLVWSAETVLHVPSAYRPVLAYLLLARGQPVRLGQLRDLADQEGVELEDVLEGLQRQGHRLEIGDSSCALPVEGGDLDLNLLYRHDENARAALAADDPVEALAAYEAGIACWGDTPLMHVPGEWAAGQRRSLLELKLTWTQRRDELRRSLQADDSFWLTIELATLPNTAADDLERSARLLYAAARTLLPSLPPTRTHWFGHDPAHLLRLRLPVDHSLSEVARWAVEELPQRMAVGMPTGAVPALFRVMVMRWDSRRFNLVPSHLAVPRRGLTFAFGVPQAVYEELTPGQRQGFRRVRPRLSSPVEHLFGRFKLVEIGVPPTAPPSPGDPGWAGPLTGDEG